MTTAPDPAGRSTAAGELSHVRADGTAHMGDVTAKQVTSTTSLGAAGRSIASVALDVAEERFHVPATALVVGTGAYARVVAAELRTRITARVGRTIREPVARTFHSYAFGVLRRAAVLRGDPAPRLLTSAEQDAVVADLLRGDADQEGVVRWPAELTEALAMPGFREELRDLLTGCGADA